MCCKERITEEWASSDESQEPEMVPSFVYLFVLCSSRKCE